MKKSARGVLEELVTHGENIHLGEYENKAIDHAILALQELLPKEKIELDKTENVQPNITIKKRCNCDREENKYCKNCGGWY